MVVSSSRFVSFRVSATLMMGRRRRCWWLWVRVWEVLGLFWALWAGLPAGVDHRLLFFFFFCNTSPKPQLQCSQEASPIYIESPTSPSQGSAGRQAGVTAAAGRCKVVNYATKWTSQKWSPHTPRPGAVADNLGVLSGRVPVLSGYPIIRGKHWYIGRETRGSSGGGGGWQWATGARWVAHRGKKKMAFHSHGVGVGVGVPWEGQPANGWRKNRDTEGDWGCTQACSREGGQ